MRFNQGVEDTSYSSDWPVPGSTHVTCHWRIVVPGNPVRFMCLQVLLYSVAANLLQLSDLICQMLLLLPTNLCNFSRKETTSKE